MSYEALKFLKLWFARFLRGARYF